MPKRVRISPDLIVEKEGAVAVVGAAADLSSLFLNASKPPLVAVLQVQVAAIRFYRGGTVPTAAAGFRADPNDLIILEDPHEIINCKYILEAGAPYLVYAFYQTRREV